ncbi:MAG: aspartate--ammonia ligase [Clostridia bacterium]
MKNNNNLVIPGGYRPNMSLKETEIAIKSCKDLFEAHLATKLNLTRVSAPLFVRPETGLNDNLNGVETPVSFPVTHMGGAMAEIVHSLAKWKRMALHRYGFLPGEGLYTDMNAIRKDEELDNLHSLYVDQWDWESIITREIRNERTLADVVVKIFRVFKIVEDLLDASFPALAPVLPDEIFFVSTEELLQVWPSCSPKEREDKITQDHKAVFIRNIGGKLSDGSIHDGRAPDYDDWELNGDIVFWSPVLRRSFEVSSMGIRVDSPSLEKQCLERNCLERLAFPYHQSVLRDVYPLTMGGGIGQSRICQFLLQKAHIGEVQSSIWPDDMSEECMQNGIVLL